MFENRAIKGIYMSRYLASWMKANDGKVFHRWDFEEWLETLVIDEEKLSQEEIRDIVSYATNGKLELEISALAFLKAKGL